VGAALLITSDGEPADQSKVMTRSGGTNPNAVDCSEMSKRASLPLVLLLLLAAGIGVWHWDQDFDDAFIGYRIAAHIGEGLGWTYNAGERVNSATSVLWTVLTALGYRVGGKAPEAARLLSVVALTLLALASWLLIRPLVSVWTAFAGVLILITSPLVLRAWGIETILYLALAVFALWISQADRPRLLGIILGAVILCRPDGVLLAGIILADQWRRSRRFPWSSVLFTAMLPGVWAAFSLFYFGSPFPNTLSAKMAQARSGLWKLGAPWPFSELPGFVIGLGWWIKRLYNWLILMFIGALVVPAIVTVRRWPRVLWMLVTWAVLHVIAYSILGVPHYHWYYAPVFPAFSALLAWGAFTASEAAGRRWFMKGPVGVCLFMVLLTHLVLAYTIKPAAGMFTRETAYRELGLWLGENTPAAARIAAAEIGVVGYYCKRPMVDIGGLIHEEGPRYLRQGDRSWWLKVRQPDVIVIHEPVWPIERPSLEDPRFGQWHDFEFPGYGKIRLLRRTASP